MKSKAAAKSEGIASRVAAIDWANVVAELDDHGSTVVGPLLTPGQCDDLVAFYENEGIFRSRVVMARHGLGRGEYQYFAYPLPPVIAELRAALYPPLAEIANRWNEAMEDVRGTEFQRRVWQALREIPAGQTSSFTDIARKIGAPKSMRAMDNACSTNNLALAILCHRVLHRDGTLSGGYHWGDARQRVLLTTVSRKRPMSDTLDQ